MLYRIMRVSSNNQNDFAHSDRLFTVGVRKCGEI